MNLLNQTCTREQGARLVELGVKPSSLFYHMPAKDGPHGEYIQYGWSGSALAPAYNGAELEDMIPAGSFQLMGRKCFIEVEKSLNGTYINVKDYDHPDELVWTVMHADGVQARAFFLCQFFEKNKELIPAHWQQDPNDPCADGHCNRPYSSDMKEIQPMPMPSEEEIGTAAFEAVYKVLKGCTINMPKYFTGHQQINGCHVKLIIDAIWKHDDNAVPGA